MKILGFILCILWRAWFYVLIVLAILILLPFLLIITGSERLHRRFFIVARLWGKIILYGTGFYPVVKRLERLQPGKPYMLVANHSSMMDVMLMYHVIKQPFVFVGKKELAKFPLFGFFYRKISILVDRKNLKSRWEVFNEADKKLRNGVSICIFPEGGVPDDESILLDRFKDGAFRMAVEHQLTVVPLVFYDTKKRFSYNWLKGSPGKLRVKILPFIPPGENNAESRHKLRDKAREMIEYELKNG